MIDTTQTGSPGWWLEFLVKKLNAKRSRITALRAYMDGNAPLPEGAEGMREAYRSFQRKARTNWGELVVEAVQERMMVAGFNVGDEALDTTAREIWAANQLDVFSGDVHTDMLGLAEGYVIVGPPETSRDRSGVMGWIARLTSKPDSSPIITREDPACVEVHTDPLRPTRVMAALKFFRDDVEQRDYAYLYLPGVVYVASRQTTNEVMSISTSGLEWVKDKAPMRFPAAFADVVPVVPFFNRRRKGEFETHTDLIDRMNYDVLQRLVIIALQAFRQRAVKGDLPPEDEEGKPIDYGSIFRPGPGALWMLPEGVELWESAIADVTPLLAASKDDIRDLAACTRTPMHMLLPDGANQSAEGATFAREGLIFKTQDRIERATYGWNRAMELALRFAGKSGNVTTLWLPPERRSLAERADAASKLSDVPWRTKMTDIMQFSPTEVERMERERMDDALVTGVSDGV